MEAEHRLFQALDSHGERYWDPVRYYVYEYLADAMIPGAGSVPPLWASPRGLGPATRAGSQLCRDLFRLARTVCARRPYLVFLASRALRNGQPADFVAEQVVRSLGIQASHIELYATSRHRRTGAPYCNRILSVWRMAHRRAPEANYGAVSTILETFRPPLTAEALNRRIAAWFQAYRIELSYYSVLFRLLRPRHIFLVQNGVQKGLIAAAHRRGAKVSELQHCFVNEFHQMYSYPRQVSYAGITTFPDYFLSFSPYWCDRVSIPGCRCVSIGNDHFAAHPPAGRRGNAIAILFADIYEEDFCELIIEIRRQSDRPAIIAKLHPNQFQDHERIRARLGMLPNVELVTNGQSVRDLLGTVAGLVAIQSTGVYEALQMGVPVYLYRRKNYLVHRDLIATGDAAVFDDAASLRELWRSERPSRPKSLFDRFSGETFAKFLLQAVAS